MIKVFNSPFKVTQRFGVNAEYYKQFGLTAHEGLDLIPTGSDWSVYSLPFKGKIVKDIDMTSKGGAYGIHTTIWYPAIGEAWMYCHLKSNTVYEGQEIDPGTYLGQMGDTGNTKGAHLHINRFKVNAAGVRQNKDNGYLGGIDPLPFLEQDLNPTPAPVPALTAQTKIPASLLTNAGEDMEIQAINGRLGDLKKAEKRIKDLEDDVNTLKALKEAREDDIRAKAKELDALRSSLPTLANYTATELFTELLRRFPLGR